MWILFWAGIFLLALILAVYWEYADHARLTSRKPINQDDDDFEREREYLFYGCFNYENNVYWRSIFIATAISMGVLVYILSQLKVPITIWLVFLIILAVFIPFYAIVTFRTFHLYRVMCNKIKPELTIL